ncbi:diadenosine tetraphosphate (Ap4A) HIT family hydrolase [Pseudomonas nitritireducens]|uniref:Diadenosine tetraphosphate (Ap4A) HIT family hydrolase n=1 Tax=Pseudomonas nitroreducens TaxID=46680 RepID=A0A7W7KJI2_PSENT|nr:HIT family protein [Pseudomonas nitritireducens]MBB4863253.1 diadenosine tetraphosphate (Ap4A) HIT family hydrolase [Pseudomonas nitritireducens]
MQIPATHLIHQTEHWLLNHHLASALPGYLMLGSKQAVQSLADLPEAALAEMGGLMAKVQRILEDTLQPKWLYIGRFGHSPGLPIHFHFIPVYAWVEEAFWADQRYRSLTQFAHIDDAATQTDGAELTLFVWREFGEAPLPPAVQGPSIEQVIEQLRGRFVQPQ